METFTSAQVEYGIGIWKGASFDRSKPRSCPGWVLPLLGATRPSGLLLLRVAVRVFETCTARRCRCHSFRSPPFPKPANLVQQTQRRPNPPPDPRLSENPITRMTSRGPLVPRNRLPTLAEVLRRSQSPHHPVPPPCEWMELRVAPLPTQEQELVCSSPARVSELGGGSAGGGGREGWDSAGEIKAGTMLGSGRADLCPTDPAGTRPPVDLYCYYLFLQREGSEDTLDFWLDVQQHENLCVSLPAAPARVETGLTPRTRRPCVLQGPAQVRSTRQGRVAAIRRVRPDTCKHLWRRYGGPERRRRRRGRRLSGRRRESESERPWSRWGVVRGGREERVLEAGGGNVRHKRPPVGGPGEVRPAHPEPNLERPLARLPPLADAQGAVPQ